MQKTEMSLRKVKKEYNLKGYLKGVCYTFVNHYEFKVCVELECVCDYWTNKSMLLYVFKVHVLKPKDYSEKLLKKYKGVQKQHAFETFGSVENKSEYLSKLQDFYTKRVKKLTSFENELPITFDRLKEDFVYLYDNK